MIEMLSTLGQSVRAQAMTGISSADEELFTRVLLQIRANLCVANNGPDTTKSSEN